MKKALLISFIIHFVFAGSAFSFWKIISSEEKKEKLVLSMAITHADAGEGKAAKGIETANADINTLQRVGKEKANQQKKKETVKKKQEVKKEKKEVKEKQKSKNVVKKEVIEEKKVEDKKVEVVEEVVEEVASLSPSVAAAAKGKQSATGAGGGKGQGANISFGGVDGVYSLKDVDGRPKSLKSVRPIYPEYAKKMRIEGTVTVSFILDEKGNIKNIKIIKAKPENIFENSAITAVKNWKFSPAMKDGIAVKVGMVVPINFKLDEK